MRIAVIADTHNRFPETLLPELRKAEEIWHLGDICHPDILIELEMAERPIYHVRGNCDDDMTWPLTRTLEREGFRFLLIHIPPAGVPGGCDVVLHGHTHVPRDETVEGVRFLNPGCITRPNRGAPASFAFLDITREQISWRIVPLQK